MNPLKKLVRKTFNAAGAEISNLQAAEKLRRERNQLRIVVDRVAYILSKIDKSNNADNALQFLQFCGDKMMKAKSQLFQELFVLYHLGEKRNGYFVEFGATDGLTLSNSWLLEKEYGWNGILAEPGKVWKQQLQDNRDCQIDKRCVWSTSGNMLSFSETDVAELSTLTNHKDMDFLAKDRKTTHSYEVETVTLNELLQFHNAPKSIDYLSVDTEGSEYEILSCFDFSKYSFGVITVEHNFSPRQQDIYTLLSKNGYQRVFEEISFFDDWYVKST